MLLNKKWPSFQKIMHSNINAPFKFSMNNSNNFSVTKFLTCYKKGLIFNCTRPAPRIWILSRFKVIPFEPE